MSIITRTDVPPRPRPSARFSARDLRNTAIFAIVLITYAIGMLGIVSPLVWVYTVLLQALVSGIPVMLLFRRVRYAGMLTLFAVVVAFFYLLTSNTILSAVGIIVLGLVAELIPWAGRYRSKCAVICAYTVFALGFLTPFLPLLVDRDAYLTDSSWAQMGYEIVTAADTLLTLPVLGVVALIILVAGSGGGLLGSAILRKHVVRTGLA